MAKLQAKRNIISRCLHAISFGKYGHGLFLDGQLHYSSAIGGLITLGLVLAIVSYSTIQFVSVFKKDTYFTESEIQDLLTFPKIREYGTLGSFE